MAKPRQITTLEKHGYEVEITHPGDEETGLPPIYSVRGHGIEAYVREDDTDQWKTLVAHPREGSS